MRLAEAEMIERTRLSRIQRQNINYMFLGNDWNIFATDIWNSRSFEENLGIIDVVFVESEADAGEFSCDVIYAWPTVRSQVELDAWNYWISELDIDLSEFDLTYPLTTSDLVHNWENMFLLISGTDSSWHEPLGRMRHRAPQYASEIARERFAQENDLLNTILEGRDFSDYGFEVPFDWDSMVYFEPATAFNEFIHDLYESELQGEIDISFVLYYANMRAGIFSREAAEFCPKED